MAPSDLWHLFSLPILADNFPRQVRQRRMSYCQSPPCTKTVPAEDRPLSGAKRKKKTVAAWQYEAHKFPYSPSVMSS